MKYKGTFIFRIGSEEFRIENRLTQQGSDAILQAIYQGVAFPAPFYIGLTNETPAFNSTLSSITVSEPSEGIGGYGRITLAQNGTDWPTLDTVNNKSRLTSKVISFVPTGANYSGPISRAFLCTSPNLAGDAAGKLISVSGQLSSAVTLTTTTPLSMQYEIILGA